MLVGLTQSLHTGVWLFSGFCQFTTLLSFSRNFSALLYIDFQHQAPLLNASKSQHMCFSEFLNESLGFLNESSEFLGRLES